MSLKSDERYFQSDDFQSLLKRYRDSLRRGSSDYFDAADFVDISDYLVDQNQLEEALEASERGLELHPTDEVLKVVHAGVLLLNGRYDEAAALIQTMDEEASADVIYLKAQLAYGRDNDIKKANAYFDRWLQLQEKNYQSALQKSHGSKMGDDDEDDEYDDDPEETLRDAYLRVALSVNDFAKTNDKAFFDLIPWIKRYEERFPTMGHCDSDMELLHLTHEAGIYQEMEILCKKFLDTNPYFENVWTYLAYAQFMNRRIDEAANSADFALAINPSDADALVVRGNCYFEHENYQAALEYFQQGHDLGNRSEDFRLACCYIKQGRKDEGVACMDEQVKYLLSEENSNMDDEEVCELLTNIAQEYLICQEHEKAFKAIDKALDILPGNLDSVKMEGELHLSMGHEKSAHTCFQYVLQNSATPYSDSFHMAVSFMRYGYLKFSTSVLVQLVETNPSEKEFPEKTFVSSFLAYATLIQGNMKDGIAWARKAMEENPQMFRELIRFDVPKLIDDSQVVEYILDHYPKGLPLQPDAMID